MRKEALKWWLQLTEKEQRETIEEWVKVTHDYRSKWDYPLISGSSGTIEAIYKEMIITNPYKPAL